jgi:hypothetical protein
MDIAWLLTIGYVYWLLIFRLRLLWLRLSLVTMSIVMAIGYWLLPLVIGYWLLPLAIGY